MAINFPNNPAVNDTFTVSGTTFTFTGVKWETSAVVEISSDTTPSLGGTLDAGTHNINNVGVITATSFSGSVTVGDDDGSKSKSVKLGDDDDLTLYYDGRGGYVTSYIESDQMIIRPKTTPSDSYIDMLHGGSVRLFHGSNTRLSTSATGVGIGGDLSVSGDLTVQGTTTTIDTAVTSVDSLQIDGNVGIGTTNATSILDVRNGIIVKDQDTSQNAANPGLQLKHNGSIYGSWRHDGRLEIGGQDANAIIRLNPNGSVAIGTATGETNFLTTINGDLSLGEKNGADNTYIDQKQDGSLEIINSGRTSNDGSVRINRHNNISGDTTYFRDFVVYDGKGTALLTVDGSAGTVSDSKGDLRKIPFKQESSAYTLVLADSGKAIEVQGDVTVPNNVFNSGDTITIINDSSSDKTISKGTGLQYMFNTADGTNANRTLGGRGMATIYFVNATTCYISGSQLT